MEHPQILPEDTADDDDSPVIVVDDNDGLLAECLIEDRRWIDLMDSAFQQQLATAFRACLERSGVDRAEVTVMLADNDRLAELNSAHRNKSGPTNVLSFPDDQDDDYLGDMALAFGVMQGEAETMGITMKHHLLHLLVHGLLHLLGHDHETDTDATVMEALETEILAVFGIADPYAVQESSAS